MVLATSYPLLEVFWTILFFFVFVVWVWILFSVLGDIFRRHDESRFTKVLWILLLVVLPYLGVFVYLVSQHNGMTERTLERNKAAQSHLDHFMQSVAVKSDPAEQIVKAKGLLDSGAITQAEFEQLKQKALAA